MKTLTLLLVLIPIAFLPSQAIGLAIGDKAPSFEAPSTQGTMRLSDFQGKKHVVLAFYIKDFTPG
jgi:K+-transporting ATPase A subunit